MLLSVIIQSNLLKVDSITLYSVFYTHQALYSNPQDDEPQDNTPDMESVTSEDIMMIVDDIGRNSLDEPEEV